MDGMTFRCGCGAANYEVREIHASKSLQGPDAFLFVERDIEGASPCPECGVVMKQILYAGRVVGTVGCSSHDPTDTMVREYALARYNMLSAEHYRIERERTDAEQRLAGPTWLQYNNAWHIKAPGGRTGDEVTVVKRDGTKSNQVLGTPVADDIFVPAVPKGRKRGKCEECGMDGHERRKGRILCNACVARNRSRYARRKS